MFSKTRRNRILYLIWYGCGRFVIEGMRTDSFDVLRYASVTVVISSINSSWNCLGRLEKKSKKHSLLSGISA